MLPGRTKQLVLDEEFLPLRAKILEIAAGLDRLDRAEGATAGDPRRARLEQALRLLTEPGERRAERVQLLFSRGFDEDWRREFGV
jgi:hypothetical protein